MTPAETGKVLVKCAAFDQRTIGEGDVMAWHEVIGHLPIDACLNAVTTHYREHSHRAMPADIRKLATDYAARERGLRDRAARQITTSRRTNPARTGAAMVRYVLDALREAGQDPAAGQFLGRERAGEVAEKASQEWLNLSADLP